jgi:hypothetical protein
MENNVIYVVMNSVHTTHLLKITHITHVIQMYVLEFSSL